MHPTTALYVLSVFRIFAVVYLLSIFIFTALFWRKWENRTTKVEGVSEGTSYSHSEDGKYIPLLVLGESAHSTHTKPSGKMHETSGERSLGSIEDGAMACLKSELEERVVILHWLMQVGISASGFWWSRLPHYPKWLVLWSRSFLGVSTLIVLIIFSWFVIEGAMSPFNASGFFVVALMTLFFFALCFSWSGFDSIGPLLHIPCVIVDGVFLRRFKKKMTFHFFLFSVLTILLPLTLDIIAGEYGISPLFRIYMWSGLLVMVFVAEYSKIIVLSITSDCFDLYFGKPSFTFRSLEECVRAFVGLERVFHHISWGLSRVVFVVFTWCLFEVVWAFVIGISESFKWFLLFVPAFLMTSVTIGLIPCSRTNHQISLLHHLYAQMLRNSLRKEDRLMFCQEFERDGIKQNQTRDLHVINAMDVMFSFKDDCDATTIRHRHNPPSVVSKLISGASVSLEGMADIEMGKETDMLTEDQRHMIKQVLKYYEIRPCGIRIFDVLISNSIVISLGGFVITYATIGIRLLFGNGVISV